MESRSGTIIDTFSVKGGQWLTVWETAKKRRWSICIAPMVGFKIGDPVRYEPLGQGNGRLLNLSKDPRYEQVYNAKDDTLIYQEFGAEPSVSENQQTFEVRKGNQLNEFIASVIQVEL